MKKTALLNAQLSYEIACLGHTDSLTICDAGLPIPKNLTRVDLALTPGTPSFLQTVSVVAEEMFVERAVIAAEIKEMNADLHATLLSFLESLQVRQNNQISVEYVSHETFKQLSQQSKAIVRSGECSPYANVILYAGVPF